MVEMTEIYNCFKFLVDSAPQWVNDVEELEGIIAERQKEMVRVPVPVSHHPQRAPSNESLRDGLPRQSNRQGYSNRMEVNSNPEASYNHNGEARAIDTMQLTMMQRKRKTTSIASNNTAPVKFRSRSMIIVYYDSRVQASFERLVRSISAGRNHIRKARMAARVEALGAGGADTNNNRPELPMFRSARIIGVPAGAGVIASGAAATDSALTACDALLDRAQDLCERGAHQFLRDGECADETAGTKLAFRELATAAQSEFTRQLVKQGERRIEEERKRSAAVAAAQQMSVPALTTYGAAPLLPDEDSNDDDLDMSNGPLPPFRRVTART